MNQESILTYLTPTLRPIFSRLGLENLVKAIYEIDDCLVLVNPLGYLKYSSGTNNLEFSVSVKILSVKSLFLVEKSYLGICDVAYAISRFRCVTSVRIDQEGNQW